MSNSNNSQFKGDSEHSFTGSNPLLTITNDEHYRICQMLPHTDETGTDQPRTLPTALSEIIALVEQWRTEQTNPEQTP